VVLILPKISKIVTPLKETSNNNKSMDDVSKAETNASK